MAQIKVTKVDSTGKLKEHNQADDITLNSFTVNGGANVLNSTGVTLSTAVLKSSGGNLQVQDSAHPVADILVGETSTETLANKSLVDASTHIVDSTDSSIAIDFNAGGTTGTKTTITAAQTANRVLTLPNLTDTLVSKTSTDTLTNKSISGATNTFSNIPNAATTATSANTPNAIVARDGSGDFAAHNTTLNKVIVAPGSGNGIDVSSPGSLEIGVSVGPNTILVGSSTSSVIVQGNLTVEGTTTTIDTTNLDVVDANISVNVGGNDASSEGAGLTVNRTGTFGSIIYKNASASRFAIGDLGGEKDAVTISDTQTLTNKTIATGSNNITSTAARAALFNGSGNLTASITTGSELGFLSGVTSQVDGISDTRTLTNKTIAVASNHITSTANRAAQYNSSTGDLEASAVTNTELGYVSGVTSSIQTQLNTKQPATTGDINLTSFSSANNQASPANVTGLAFANANIRAAKIQLSVSVDATSDLFESFDMEAIQRGADWLLAYSSQGNNTGYSFDITNAGQVTYTNQNYAGFVSGTVKFRSTILTT